MWKQITVQGKTKYLDILPEILKQYNNTKHLSIKMTPIETPETNKNHWTVYFNFYGYTEQLSSKVKFKIDDKVISKYKRKVSDKGYTPNWSEEVHSAFFLLRTNLLRTLRLKSFEK